MKKDYDGEKYADSVILGIKKDLFFKAKIEEVIESGLEACLKPEIKQKYDAMRRV